MSSMIQMLRPCVPSDQIVVARMDQDVVDAHGRQPVHEPLPRLAAVERDVDAVLGAEVQQVAVLRILADHVDVAPPAGRRRPTSRSRRSPSSRTRRPCDRRCDGRRRSRRRCRRRSGDASTRDTCVSFGTPGTLSTTFFQVAPPSRLTCTLPSLVPTHTMPGSTGRLGDRDDVAVRGRAVVLRGHRRLAVHAHDRPIVAADVPGQVGRRQPRVAAVVSTGTADRRRDRSSTGCAARA